MNKKDISIIVPIYNAEKYLNQCISSVANQTLQDIEIIAINDGSTDNSLNVLDELSCKYKGKLKVFTKEAMIQMRSLQMILLVI